MIEKIEKIKALVSDEFSLMLLNGAKKAYSVADTPLRLNFFCVAMRMLYEHIMHNHAIPNEIIESRWFKPDPSKADGMPTRKQKLIFAIKGGLDDAFIEEELDFEFQPSLKSLIETLDDLSKHIHGTENNIVSVLEAQNSEMEKIANEVNVFVENFSKLRALIITKIEENIQETAINELLRETILAIDELATHHSIEEILVEDVKVKNILSKVIVYEATGSIGATLQWGSNSDLRKGDGAELEETFPFLCRIEVPIDCPFDIKLAEISYEIDQGDWSRDHDYIE
jgi:hypothetical protein